MPLQRERFTVYTADPDHADTVREHTAIITHQDMLRGEAAVVGTPGQSIDQYLTLVTAWCWASLMRQGDYAGAFQVFRDMDCQGVEKLEAVDVDPTPPGTSDASP